MAITFYLLWDLKKMTVDHWTAEDDRLNFVLQKLQSRPPPPVVWVLRSRDFFLTLRKSYFPSESQGECFPLIEVRRPTAEPKTVAGDLPVKVTIREQQGRPGWWTASCAVCGSTGQPSFPPATSVCVVCAPLQEVSSWWQVSGYRFSQSLLCNLRPVVGISCSAFVLSWGWKPTDGSFGGSDPALSRTYHSVNKHRGAHSGNC